MKKRILAITAAVAVLAFAFWYGGDAPGLRGWNVAESETMEIETAEDPQKEPEEPPKTESMHSIEQTENPTEKLPEKADVDESKVKIQESAEPKKIEEDIPKETASLKPEKTVSPESLPQIPEMIPSEKKNEEKAENTCILSVRCDTILQNMAWLDADKVSIVPADGVILSERSVSFSDGESVFDVLVREMRLNGIQMEFENTPMYKSAYIEGIGNIYEFDCGEQSGWMYRVNGEFPNFGCSLYTIKPGDKVEWVYTCNLGADVGNKYYGGK